MESYTPLSVVRTYYLANFLTPHGRFQASDHPYRFYKRFIDLLLATFLLATAVPIMVVIALLIKLDSRGPIIYRREVVGKHGRPFQAYKFRTMYVQAEGILAAQPQLQEELAAHGKIKNDPRVTPFGRWLRRSSLDELPQLINVLKREMSLIGPRMVTLEELARFGEFGPIMLSVEPGISGLWQVNGRADAPYEDRIYLNMVYISQWSPRLDLLILLRTIPAVFSGRGAY